MTRGLWRAVAVWLVASSANGCRCGEPAVVDVEAVEASTETGAPPEDVVASLGSPTSLVVADVATLEATDLGYVVDLDLAMSEIDGQERPLPLPESVEIETDIETGESLPPSRIPEVLSHPRCEGLDLHMVAERAPRLRRLRISGCQAAVHAGLSAFGSRLRQLELVDIQLDAVTVARLSQLYGLDELVLTRVQAEPEVLKPLGRKISPRAVTLRDLVDDSAVAEIFGILPDIREIRIEGPWPTHTTMILVGKAKRLESLAVIDTAIGNYSIHQIKPLEHLHRLEWAGTGFNDSTPLFLKQLPIDELICTCTRLGDDGLHYLALLEGLRVLQLERSEVTSAGLAELSKLVHLERIVIRDRSIDGDGFAALAKLPALRELVLSPGTLDDPEAAHLGELVGLRGLEINLEGFGDGAAPQLATLIQLERLDLGGSEISDEGLRHLAPLVRLRHLELHHTRVTKLGSGTLDQMSALEILELDHTDIVDEGVSRLGGLISLRDLRLDHTLITDAALVHVAKLMNLERLNLAHTVVSAAGLAVLETLPKLQAVNLEGTRAGR